ncbi:MAG: hypothetical protein Q9225_001947 [Loekoesia sp. 1 TL-2023]
MASRTKDPIHGSPPGIARSNASVFTNRSWLWLAAQTVGVVICCQSQVAKPRILSAAKAARDTQMTNVGHILRHPLIAANDPTGGGDNTWSVSLTGLDNNVGSVPDSGSDSSSDSKPNPPPKAAASTPSPSSSSSTPTSTTLSPAAKSKPTGPAAAAAQPDSTKNKPPSTITRASTVVVTAPGQTQAAPVTIETHKPSKGPNTAGIAAGVVVGVIAICAIAGGFYFFLRNRKRRAIEEEYQRNTANPFETESKPPPSSCSMSDSRLEPSVMMQRRLSDGSIADNQDYSRRILKVGL